MTKLSEASINEGEGPEYFLSQNTKSSLSNRVKVTMRFNIQCAAGSTEVLFGTLILIHVVSVVVYILPKYLPKSSSMSSNNLKRTKCM